MKYKNQIAGLKTWVEVDRRAIQHNFDTFSKILEKTAAKEKRKKPLFMGVVKSNAYGHGIMDYARELEQLGADYLGVDSVIEAVRLREEGIKTPILVLGYTLPDNIEIAIKKNIEITLSSQNQLKKLLALEIRKPIKVHVKIDTGMHRQGFYADEAEKIAKQLQKTKNVTVKGIYTHFANGKNPSFPQDSRVQMERFGVAVNAFEETGYKNIIRHACATSGTILYPEYHFDMVRIGIGIYGLWPSTETQRAYESKITLKPALAWKAVIGEVKKASKGEGIGYNYTELFEQDKKLAVIPIGYWHGYVRLLSSIGHVLIEGKRSRVLGLISMDITVTDVTHNNKVKSNSIVTLLGRDGSEEITADEIGKYTGTTCYEVVTRINPKIKRTYIN